MSRDSLGKSCFDATTTHCIMPVFLVAIEVIVLWFEAYLLVSYAKSGYCSCKNIRIWLSAIIVVESLLLMIQYILFNELTLPQYYQAFNRVLVLIKTTITFLSLYYVFRKASKPLPKGDKVRYLRLLWLLFMVVMPVNLIIVAIDDINQQNYIASR